MDQGVGREIKRLREERGWSQAKLAVEAEMSVSGVSMIENGQRNLTTTTLAKLAGAFGLEIADLFPKAPAPLQLELAEQAGKGEAVLRLGALELVSLYEELIREALRRVEAGESRDFVVRELATLFEKELRTGAEVAVRAAREFGVSPRSWDEELRREFKRRTNAGEDRVALVQEYGRTFEEMFEEILNDEVISGGVQRQAMLRGDA